MDSGANVPFWGFDDDHDRGHVYVSKYPKPDILGAADTIPASLCSIL